MQLLERADGKKWYLWVKQGRLASENFHTNVKDFFSKYDAMVEYESYFSKKTGNKWSDRSSFQQKPGLYILLRKETELEVISKFQQLEKELFNLINEGKAKFTTHKNVAI